MEEQRVSKIEKSSQLIGKAVVSSILVTLISFSPILFLSGQEHKFLHLSLSEVKSEKMYLTI